MNHSDNLQNVFQQNPNGMYSGWGGNPAQAWGQAFGIGAQGYGPSQHGLGNAFGQPAFGYGSNFGGGQGWGQNIGGQYGNPWQQRQLSHHEVGEVVRQLLPILPQVIAQAQQPQAAFGGGYGNYGGGFGAAYGSAGRNLSQQDVNEVVRQILPVIPQIVGLLQQGQQGAYANAAYGGGMGLNHFGGGNQGWNNNQNQGWGNPGLHNQGGYGNQNPYQLSLFGQNQPNAFGGGYGQAAFGGGAQGFGQQRQLNQAEVGEIVRQLTSALPQVIANLQAMNQQPNVQRAA